MLAIAAVTVFMSAPGQSFSVAAFIDPMLADLRLERTSYSMAYMVATILGGITLPFVGRLIDRFGARVMLPIVALGLGLACGWMSWLTTLAGLYAGFTMIRCLGQGSLTLLSNWIIGEWFQERRGLAAGICAIGGTASVLIIPQLNNLLIAGYGWRNAWTIMGGMVVISLVLPAVFLLRDRPEALGLLPDWGRKKCPDGGIASPIAARPRKHRPDPPLTFDQSFTLQQALRTSAFWKVASVIATVSLVGTGLVFHQVSILGEQGVSRTAALGLLGVQATAATISTLTAGFLMDKLPVRFVLACSMVFQICALLLLHFLPSPAWIVLYAILLGLQGGIIRSAGSMVWITYFGRRYQGSIQGISMSIMVLAAALGPVPVAIAYDWTGHYNAALLGFLVLPIVAGLSVLSAIPPGREGEEQGART